MEFDKKYFESLDYSLRESMIKRFGLNVLSWASKKVGSNLFDGKGKRALDVGCSFGYITSLLERMKYETYGLDVSTYALREAARKRKTYAHLLACDVQYSLPFPQKTFDLITCFDVLEHLKKPAKALENMYKVCKGVIICTTPHRLLDKALKTLGGDYDETHINLRTPGEWRKIIEKKLGISPDKLFIETYYEVPIRLSNRLLAFKSIKMPKIGLNIRILIKV